ncbi:MAG: two-component system response regulator [Zetaproteobacteria bacterium CG_4_9_14_3_um_filter_49_83]|nr:MAG: hypothetical protein AUJ56_04405 [Zetaproteobacteria bacterium CG1_02_49_23]PIQ31652.1 MAG: two-component system response regulator [Zetaproteobacteria bacterium CG17_big_fil_post_rev_8_21_14_2_50_50_13]PIV31157.1 MAG: two-component system response regulator [Zetaproteobacteria bacterium CG02_land_8_20_14_3_00_50_9]PIY55518.1 MAG: two-component system response regulator [Zetaproteobacteria bacterium CG_4_10_14_0_8_um_filter_49_80]PJA34874.1 MAG: two-component system response regulator [
MSCKKNILLIEDNCDHAEIACFHIAEYAPEIKVTWLRDGEMAIHHIEHHGTGENNPYPWLILLDIKLPKFDGHEVLARIKANSFMRKVPVVMFTTSNATPDIDRAILAGANSYIQKPATIDGFSDVIAKMIDYWSLDQHAVLLEGLNRHE